MRSERLRWLLRAEGPFASVYFDDSHDTADAAEELETRWRDTSLRRGQLSPQTDGSAVRLLRSRPKVITHVRTGREQN